MKTDDELKKSANRFFGHLVERHPWFYNAFIANEKIAAELNQYGRDAILRKTRPLTPEDQLDFARTLQSNPDMWSYFEDFAEQRKDDMDTEFEEGFPEAMRYFIQMFLHDRNLIGHVGSNMSGGRMVAQRFLAGDIPSIDGTEAYEIACKHLD